MQNRPRARRKFVSRPSSSSSGGGSYGGGGYSGGGYSGGGRSRGGGGTLIKIIIIAFLLLGGGGGALSGNLESLLGLGGQDVSSLISSGSGTQSGWLAPSNSGTLNTRVSSDARDKFTTIKGLGKDKVTIMVYMCGTDLESRSGMATSDINEMLSANMSDNVNIIMYTGGCSAWKNSKISSRVNQIWQVADGKFKCLDKNAGTGAMTDPNTLAKFINWTKKNFPANRNELIFWDHGGGSISGFGYDEKNKRSGSMTLAGIDKALTNGGVKFDFVGFDACLMATTETALMLGDHADYMIGSEETEPGIGWYYTNWLTELSDDTSMETIRIGQRIADDFTEACARRCPGQQTTLSVVDLAELSKTVPGKLKKFSANASRMIEDGDYSTLATARSGSKEFARSSGIDQIDFVHFAKMMDTDAANDLADTLLEAVKYNRTSNNISNSYGLSIYFPYRKTNKVDTISKTYNEIGMDNEYTSCIKRFAQVQVSGQAVAGGSQSPIESLFGGGSSGSFGGSAAQDLISTLLMGGRSIDRAGIDDLNASNTEFMSEDLLDAETIAENVTANRIEDGDLTWKSNSDGQKVIKLTEDQWKNISSVDMNMFYDNGNGYIDFGLDNVYEFDDEGNLLPDVDGTWLALDGMPVTYYHDETLELGGGAYQITGHVPVKLNGEKAYLILVFDNENEKGRIAGVRFEYDEKTTETAAKAKSNLEEGDKVTFLYNVFTKDGREKKDVAMGNTLYVQDPADIDISNVEVGSGKSKITFKFTDIFGQQYWTEEL